MNISRNHIIYGLTILLSVLIAILGTVIACCVDIKSCLKIVIVISSLILITIIWIFIIFLTVRKKDDIIKQNINRLINKRVDDFIIKNKFNENDIKIEKQIICDIKKINDLEKDEQNIN